ncbi:hypothetical protein CWC31_00920 [Pseudoalteromonas ruthenica]|uniref:DUF2071 domain-containing protein n=1 Tax=Pseudoalteromonas ruthenica TaxID=151081 RepID=UPI0011087731|nr:DUF2071 domain-containing protein [Pseudoalteromonas ruthenica]TLX52430.1 hypothetical protein CWC31_00920 [Pseudoalteromonas ruthenica]
MDSLKLKDFLHPRPAPRGIDVLCKLQHFSIITYAVNPSRFEGLFPERFELDTLEINGEEKALISVVPFIDVDFTSAVFPFPKFTMGQTNYRIYIIDKKTNEKCVWFLGTTLDSWTFAVPRFVWNLPWYSGKVKFDCEFDSSTRLYSKYKMVTQADWAPAHVELTQSPESKLELPGFPDVETGLVYLTHPLAGFYYRRDGQLGTYRVWHKALEVKPANLESANFGLLSRLGLVTPEEQQVAHSVLVGPINEFTIYLPPKVIR